MHMMRFTANPRPRGCSSQRTNLQRRTLVGFLTRPEIEALLAAPNRTKWLGRRDRAFLTIVRDDRVAARGCRARSRRTCALSGKNRKGTLYSFGQTHGRGPQSLDSG